MKNKILPFFALITTFFMLFVCNNQVFAQPANDECASATLLSLTVDSTCIQGTNVGATNSTFAPLPQGFDNGYAGDDVWYKFVAPESGRVVIRTGSTTSTPTITEGGLALYSGNCGPTLSQLALSTEGLNGSYMPRLDTDDYDVVLTEGTTYYIRFWAYENNEHGTFNMCIWTIPIIAGNECSEATPLYTQFECNYRKFHNLYSTPSSGVPNPTCGNYSAAMAGSGDVWFQVEAPANGYLKIQTAQTTDLQSLTDCGMSAYRGTCTSLSLLGCNAGTVANTMPSLEFSNLVPGETIYIRFWDKQCNERGYFNICCFTKRPDNDNCADAIPLNAPMASSCVYEVYTTYGASNQSGFSTPNCGNYQGSDVWFTVSVEVGRRIVVTTEWGDIMNGALALYSGECTNLSFLQCVEGSMPEISMQGFTEDQTLYVRFWPVGNLQTGTFGICAYTTEEIGVNMGDSTICHTNCSEFDPLIICDDGGTGDYSQNRDDTLTIYSADLENGFIALKFLEMDIAPTDTLFIYNGPTADPQYLTYQFGSLQTSWANNSNTFGLGDETGLTITAFWPNTSGAITLRFKTGSTGGGTGFRLRSSCNVLCQPIEVNVTQMSNNIIYHPSGEPVNVLYEGGYNYINLCPQPAPYDTITDSISVFGIVNYPYSDTIYHQDNSTSLFTWRYGSQVISGYGLDHLTKHFIAGQGTAVSLTVTDTVGCIAPNIASYRIRASQRPIKSVEGLIGANVCAGDQLNVTFGYDPNNSVIIDPIGDEQISSLAVSDTIFLPDGQNCPPYGYYYRSPVTFDAFSTSDMIESVDDILSVCINIEHSYIGDIRISLECPNGSSVMLLPDYQDTGWPTTGSSTSSWLGEANEIDDSGDGCTANQYSMGNGWNYCWSNNTDHGYVYSTSPNGYIYENANIISHFNVFHNATRSTIDSTNKAEMTQVYHPVESFDNLIGCPMNGTWFIEVEDTWGIDNGFLFGWDLSLAPRLMPQAWEYNVYIDEVTPNGPFINTALGTDTSFVVEPPSDTEPGIYEYTFSITDSYGCVFPLDSTFQVIVHQAFASYYAEEICQGNPYNNFGFYVADPQPSSTGGDTILYFSKFNLQTQEFGCDSSLTLALTVHPNKETFFYGSICVGDVYNLNGFNITGYTEGDWIYRNVNITSYGCDTVATLYLSIVSTPETEIIGITNICLGTSTTLTANGGNSNSTYLWSTGETSQSITVTPNNDTEYSVTIFNAEGCSESASVTVYVGNYPLPSLQIEGNLNIQCGESTTLNAIDNNNVTTIYEWKKDGVVIPGETGSSITVSPTSNAIYTVKGRSNHNCTGMTEASVEVTANSISINASALVISYGSTTTLTANNITGVPSTFVWTYGNSSETGSSITVSPTEETTYYLEATTLDGNCVSYAEITISVIFIYAPPQDVTPEFLIGGVDSSCRAIIYWTAPDPEILIAGGVFVGYNVFRDGELLTPEPISLDSLLDTQLPEGVYIYCVSCVYETGESEKICSEINFVAEYNAPSFMFYSRTENCEASLYWNSPIKNCWANLEGYYIYRDGDLIDSVLADGVFDTIYTDKNIGESEHHYCIKAYYIDSYNRKHVSDSLCEFVNTCYHVAINVYPNPAKTDVTIVANNITYISLFDGSGRFIKQYFASDDYCRSLTIPIQNLPEGTYLLNIVMKDGISAQRTFIIRR